jgi:hypothetical protein
MSGFGRQKLGTVLEENFAKSCSFSRPHSKENNAQTAWEMGVAPSPVDS